MSHVYVNLKPRSAVSEFCVGDNVCRTVRHQGIRSKQSATISKVIPPREVPYYQYNLVDMSGTQVAENVPEADLSTVN